LTGCILAIVYFTGIRIVPFHPDESTTIFMANDFKRYLSDPFSLMYQSTDISDPIENLRQHYRLIDAPLTRYIIGFGLALQNQTPIYTDWNWSSTWEENQSMGALPTERILFVSRISVAGLFLLTLLLSYLIGKNLFGPLAGEILLILTGTHALYLLHTRRAMAEGALIFSIYLVLWLLPHARSKPVWLGLAAGLAFCAKQSLIPLAAVAGIAVLLPDPADDQFQWKVSILKGLKFFITFLAIFMLFNPVYWSDPIGVIKIGLDERHVLLQSQIADWGDYSLLTAPVTAILFYLANSFFLPPAYAEATNYLTATAKQVELYQSNSINTLLSGVFWGSLLMIFSLTGVIFLLKNLHKFDSGKRRTIILYISVAVLQLFFTLIFLPIPWQRYVLPTVPYVLIFASYAVHELILMGKAKLLPVKNLQEQL
jgi:4-amino-4-deoxy-L-arabinose transferase-like glycosyltransferase